MSLNYLKTLSFWLNRQIFKHLFLFQELHGMREKLEDANRSLDRNSLEKLKRESQTRVERDRLQIGEFQLEISRLKSQLEEKVSKYESNKSALVEQLSKEKEAKFEMASFDWIDIKFKIMQFKTTWMF